MWHADIQDFQCATTKEMGKTKQKSDGSSVESELQICTTKD